jgi:hypothetical protein
VRCGVLELIVSFGVLELIGSYQFQHPKTPSIPTP